MQYNESKTLIQLQAELVDTKVELAVNKAINQVVDQIVSLKYEIHRDMGDLRQEMGEIKGDIIAVKTRLGMTLEPTDEIRKRWIEYSFKTVWIIGLAVVSYLLGHLHFFQ
jgi:uncharacterized coiled-coil DUF342 family protein